MKAPEAPDYDPNEIIPGIPLSIGDAWLEDTEWRLTLADALADVLQRACEAEQPPPPQTTALALRHLRQVYLHTALADIRSDRRGSGSWRRGGRPHERRPLTCLAREPGVALEAGDYRTAGHGEAPLPRMTIT